MWHLGWVQKTESAFPVSGVMVHKWKTIAPVPNSFYRNPLKRSNFSWDPSPQVTYSQLLLQSPTEKYVNTAIFCCYSQ